MCFIKLMVMNESRLSLIILQSTAVTAKGLFTVSLNYFMLLFI